MFEIYIQYNFFFKGTDKCMNTLFFINYPTFFYLMTVIVLHTIDFSFFCGCLWHLTSDAQSNPSAWMASNAATPHAVLAKHFMVSSQVYDTLCIFSLLHLTRFVCLIVLGFMLHQQYFSYFWRPAHYRWRKTPDTKLSVRDQSSNWANPHNVDCKIIKVTLVVVHLSCTHALGKKT